MAWVWFIVALGMLGAAGCEDTILYQRFDRQMWSNYINLNQVHKGMSQREVEAQVGPPRVKEEGDYQGGHFVFYFYHTHSMDQEGSNTVRGGFTPLVFKGDRLVGIGAREYKMATDQFPYADEMPDSPWKRVH